jgi:hypothetical protein
MHIPIYKYMDNVMNISTICKYAVVQYMYKCCAIYVFNRVELTCQMILDKGSGFLHLLDDIATKDCFRDIAV